MTKQDLIEYIKVRVFPNMSNLVTGLNNQQALLALIDDCYNYRSIVNAVKSTSPSGITLTFSDGSSTTIPFDSAPTVPIASSSTLGAIKVGDGLSINSTGTLSTTYSYTLPVASSSVLGGIMVGGGLAINNGVLSVTATYTLPTASNSVLGGIKIGDGLTISNGFVSPNIGVAINGGTSPLFYIGQKHLIITGQGNVSVTSNNSNNEIYINYNLPIATDTSPGGIIIGDGLYIDNAGALNVSGSYSYNIGLSGNTSAIVGNNDTVKFSEGAGIDISHNNDAISKIQTFEFEIKPATTNELGGVVIGNNILIDSNGSISIPIADSDTLGLIRVGDGLDINNGVLSVEPSNDYVSLNVLSSDGQSFVSTSTVSQSSKQINLKPSGYITLGRTGTISSDKYGIVIGTDIPVATSSTFGLVKTGSNISVSGGTISVPSASDTVAGVIKLGGGLTIDQNGVASVSYSYTLPIATNDVLGGVKIGAGIAISNDGVISNSYSYSFSVTTPTASDYYDVLGGNLVIFDGSNGIKSSLVSVPGTHTVTYSGVEATKNSIGVVIVGDNIDVDTTGKISIPIASATTAGVIKLGDGLSVDSNGFVSVSNNYSFSFGGYSGSTYIKNTVNNGDSIV
jgi:hypothetical protein